MVGLILLVVLTMLAVSGMNSASTELIMAGNEQYRQSAFQAAQTGIEQAIADLASVPQSSSPIVVPPTAVAGSATDRYSTSSRYMGEESNVAGASTGDFVGFHYEIISTGTSARNATSQHVQGAFVIQNSGGAGTFGPLGP